MTATIPDEHGRVDPDPNGDELTTLLGFLRYQRATFRWKTSGLDAEQLRTALAPSTMTLGGMVKHLAFVEDDWFQRVLLGREWPEPWASAHWDADRDWEWHSAAEDSPGELTALWERAVTVADAATMQVATSLGLGGRAVTPWSTGEHASLRWILTHMVEEYARHNGHADLIRESIDGSVGE